MVCSRAAYQTRQSSIQHQTGQWFGQDYGTPNYRDTTILHKTVDVPTCWTMCVVCPQSRLRSAPEPVVAPTNPLSIKCRTIELSVHVYCYVNRGPSWVFVGFHIATKTTRLYEFFRVPTWQRFGKLNVWKHLMSARLLKISICSAASFKFTCLFTFS